jgi:hypothetical protein
VSITVVDPDEPIDLIVFDLSGLICADGGEPIVDESGGCCCW